MTGARPGTAGAAEANGQRDVDEAGVVSVMDTVMAGVLDVACAMGVVAVAMVTGMADVAHGNRAGRPGGAGHARGPFRTGRAGRRHGPLRPGARRPSAAPAHARPGHPAYAQIRHAPYGTTGPLPRRRADLSRTAQGICVQAAQRGDGA